MSTPLDLRRAALTRWIIYALVAASVAVPFLFHLRMKKLTVSRYTQQLYDAVEALPPGKAVLISMDYDPASMAELHPMATGLLRHCFRRGLKPLVMTFWPSNLGLCKDVIEQTAAEYHKQSGRDYVFLGFRAGGQNLILNMGENLQRAFEKDFDDQPTAGMPALEGVRSLKDVPMAVDLAAGNSIEMWIAYGRDRFKFALGAGCTGVMAPDQYPFLQSGQLVGLLGGLRGAAEYEKLLDQPGAGMSGMFAQSVTHILIIVLIVGANAAIIIRRLRGGKKG